MSTASAAPGVARGYAWIVLSNLVFAVGFSFVAAIDGALSVWQLVLARGVVFGLALLPWAVRHRDIARGSDCKLLLLRGSLGTAMILCLLWAVTALPLSVATLLGKTTPLWELLMLWLLLALLLHLSELLLVPVAILGLVMHSPPRGTAQPAGAQPCRPRPGACRRHAQQPRVHHPAPAAGQRSDLIRSICGTRRS